MHPETYAYFGVPIPRYRTVEARPVTMTIELTVDAVDTLLSATNTAAQVIAQLPSKYHPKLINITEGEVQ